MHHFVLLFLLAGPAPSPVVSSGDDGPLATAVVRTGKERLGIKASDEQKFRRVKLKRSGLCPETRPVALPPGPPAKAEPLQTHTLK